MFKAFLFILLAAAPFRFNGALAQFDQLGDEDRCFLGEADYCRAEPTTESANKAEQAEEIGEGIVDGEREPVSTCRLLPQSVAVLGHNNNTQCRIVDGAGVGKMNLIRRGLLAAVDVWAYVNGGIEVCFHHPGVMVFLDADYAPRMVSEMETYERDGMTCGAISGHGTVALLPHPAPTDEAAESCQIKLTETLFLRAEPAGEIIGLVWLNSEVPVFETVGQWRQVAFEGQTGYISGAYHRVLRGNCV